MLNERIKKMRIERNMTQQELANKLNLATSTIGMYERGERIPDIYTLIELSKMFKTTTDYLLGLSDNPNEYDSESDKMFKRLNELEKSIILTIVKKYLDTKDKSTTNK